MPMICSSENLLRFMSSVLSMGGLYFKLEEFARGRSSMLTADFKVQPSSPRSSLSSASQWDGSK